MFFIVDDILISPIEVDGIIRRSGSGSRNGSGGSGSGGGSGCDWCGMIEFIQLGDDRARLDV